MINAECKKTQCGSDAWWQAKGAAKLMSCCFCRILPCFTFIYHHVALSSSSMWTFLSCTKTLWMTQDHCDNLVKKVDYWSSQMMGGWLFIEGGTPLHSTHWSYQTGEGPQWGLLIVQSRIPIKPISFNSVCHGNPLLGPKSQNFGVFGVSTIRSTEHLFPC